MSITASRQWFATCPKGIEGLLMAELQALGATTARETVAGVYFDGPLALGYRACLWSRLANRILLPLARLEAQDADELYRGLMAVAWDEVLGPEQTFTIDFTGENAHIRNTQFGAQRCKDAIVDWFQARTGQRPSVDRKDPDLRFNVRLSRHGILLALDMSGGSLHRRNYRLQAGAAPLKENGIGSCRASRLALRNTSSSGMTLSPLSTSSSRDLSDRPRLSASCLSDNPAVSRVSRRKCPASTMASSRSGSMVLSSALRSWCWI